MIEPRHDKDENDIVRDLFMRIRYIPWRAINITTTAAMCQRRATVTVTVMIPWEIHVDWTGYLQR